jgi:predicted nucleic acid-binding protein
VTVLVDTSVLIDYLRGHVGAASVLERERVLGPLHASEISRMEVLSGMRSSEERATRSLLSTLIWHPVDNEVAEAAGALGREWLPSHRSIDSADLATAGTALCLDAELPHLQRQAPSDDPEPHRSLLTRSERRTNLCAREDSG